MPLSYAFLQSSAAPSMTPGLDVFVHDVMAAMTTDPCFNSKFCPLNSNLTVDSTSYGFMPNPLNPGSAVKLLVQSDLSYFNRM